MNSKGKKIVVTSVAFIALIVLCSTVQYGLSAPIVTPIAVKMDNSSSVNAASQTLEENVPGILVVDYNSPTYYLIIWRAYGGVIWVGHGSQEGVKSEQELLSWETLAARVESTPSKDIVLACYSAMILGYLPQDSVLLSFNGEIDAKLGALIASYDLTGSESMLVQAFQRFASLLGGKVQPSPLLAEGEEYIGNTYLTNYELVMFIGSVLFFCALYLLPSLACFYSEYYSAWLTVAFPIVLNGITTIVTQFSYYQNGWISIVDFVWAIFGIIAGVAIAMVQALPWYIVLLIGLGWVILTVATAGTYWAGAILAVIGFLIPALVQLAIDYNDYNGAPPTANPTPPPGDGGGGCPYLWVYDGSEYVNEGLLDIHTGYNGTDLVRSHTLTDAPAIVGHTYMFRLTEHWQTISHIDQVRLYATLSNGMTIQLPLVSAVHSQYGNVLPQLLRSDDWRVEELGAEWNDGTSQSIDLRFIALPPWIHPVSFNFVIEGYNPYLKY